MVIVKGWLIVTIAQAEEMVPESIPPEARIIRGWSNSIWDQFNQYEKEQ